MKRTTMGIVALLLGALFYLQFGVLEKTEVQRLERASQNLGELRASDHLPTYVGSLFLGAFRAVAIDVLWIQMHRMGEEEHRYFERVEIMDLITKLQPRNPEAWAYQGWDAAFNIANHSRTSEYEAQARELRRRIKAGGPGIKEWEEQLKKTEAIIRKKDAQFRTWVRVGLRNLAKGSRYLPDDPYLKSEVAHTLWTKSSWSAGVMEEQFLKAIEEDKELQEDLGEGPMPARPRTAFELSEIWFLKGQAALEKQIQQGSFRVFRTLAESMNRPPEGERSHHTTQIGRNIDRATFTGFIYTVRYLNGILKWYRARDASPDEARALLLEASESFRKAQAQAAYYRKNFSFPDLKIRDLHDARVDLCRGLADLCADLAKLPHPLSAEDRARLLTRLEPIRWNPIDRNATPSERVAPPDDRYVLNYMNRLKRSLGGDGWEYNDDLYTLHYENYLGPGERADATIGPDADDVDWYHFYAARPAKKEHEGHSHDEEPAPAAGPVTADFQVKRVGDWTLTVTVLAFRRGTYSPVKSLEVSDNEPLNFEVTSERAGPVYIMVSGKSPLGTPSTGSGYSLTAVGVRP